MLLVTKETSAWENKMIDHVIKILPVDNNRLHEEGSKTLKDLEDPQQKDKDEYSVFFMVPIFLKKDRELF